MAALAHQQESGLSGLSSPVTEDSDGTLDSDEDDYDHDNLDIDLDEDDDLDDFSSYEEEEVMPRPIIAKMKQGCTIMNGKGELVGFTSNHSHDTNDKFGRKVVSIL